METPVTVAFVGYAEADRADVASAYDAFLADERRRALIDQHGEVFASKIVVELETLADELR